MDKLIFFIFLVLNVQYVFTINDDMEFVTSSNNDRNKQHQIKRIPAPVTVTSRPFVNVKDGPIEAEEDNISVESKLGAWRRWFAKENLTKTLSANPNEKTFTQQQILDKLFSDYHKHLKEQLNGKNLTDGAETSRYQNSGSYRPRPPQSQWPIDIETIEDSRPTPSAAMSNNKYNPRPPPHLLANPPKDGWVSLEPIPWSSSKVSKWTPNRVGTSTQLPPTQQWGFNTNNFNTNNFNTNNYPSKPSFNQDRPQTSAWVNNKPTSSWSTEKPLYIDHNKPSFDSPVNKPTWSEIPSKPQWSESTNKPTWADAPNKPSWNDAPYKPSWGADVPSKPSWASETPTKPNWDDTPNKPSWSETSNKPLWQDPPSRPGWTDLSSKPVTLNKPVSSASWGSIRPPSSSSGTHITPLGIITDGKPPEWPSDPPPYKPAKPSYSAPTQRPTSWQRPQAWGTRPSLGSNVYKGDDDEKHAVPSEAAATDDDAGKWVLLSSTRGYTTAPITSSGSSGRGTRAFKFTPNTVSMSTNRGIRLTVLPAINNTSVISHGGLLEVDKTFETVDAAATAANFATIQAVDLPTSTIHPTVIKGHKNKYGNKKPKPAKQQSNSTNLGTSGVRVFTAGQPTATETQNRNKALIAAIGAGMLPATMAALVPMFLGKRRRRRDVNEASFIHVPMLLGGARRRSRRHVVDDMLERRAPILWYALPRSNLNVRRTKRAIIRL